MSSQFALSGGGVYSAEHGQILEAPVMRLAEILKDYNQYFELQFIPANTAASSDGKPFRVVDNTPGSPRYVVRYITEQEMRNPQQVLADIWAGDLRYHSPDAILDDMDLKDRAARLMQLKRDEETAAENEEILAFYLSGGRDGRHYLNYNGHKIGR